MKKCNGITELAESLLPFMLDDTTGVIKSNASHKFNVLLQAKTCEYDIDLGLKTGFSKSRWTRLINQYVDKTRLASFVKLTQSLDTQCSTSMLFKFVVGKKLDHQYGNCLLSVCYCDDILTLFSRTCFAGYMSYFDLALAHKIAEKIGSVSTISFRWYVVDLQLSYLRSLQVIFLDKKLMGKLNYLVNYPKELAHETISWQRVVGVYRRRFLYHYNKSGLSMLKEAKYGPTKRYIKRWLILQDKIEGTYPKSYKLSELEL